MTATAEQHPIDRLEECTDPAQALFVLEEACDFEIAMAHLAGEAAIYPEFVGEYRQKVRRCLGEYRAALEQVTATLAERWQAEDDEDIREIGRALATGDCNRLGF